MLKLDVLNRWAIGNLESIGTTYASILSGEVSVECPFNLQSEMWRWLDHSQNNGVWDIEERNEIKVECIKGICFKN